MFIDERCRRVSIEWRKQKKLFMSHKRWSTTQLTRHRILQTLSIYISYGVRWFSENYTNCVERWRTTHTHTQKRIETVPRHQAHGQKHTAVFCSSQCFDEICFIARSHLLPAFIHICQRLCFFPVLTFFGCCCCCLMSKTFDCVPFAWDTSQTTGNILKLVFIYLFGEKCALNGAISRILFTNTIDSSLRIDRPHVRIHRNWLIRIRHFVDRRTFYLCLEFLRKYASYHFTICWISIKNALNSRQSIDLFRFCLCGCLLEINSTAHFQNMVKITKSSRRRMQLSPFAWI